ncbi:carbohydrate sulfotransferase 8 [Hyalella azteca]|uniref:Carbohydrate sulfotransferase n=1 Tax=Hyalella azteca TaxID=294128 RepID=A0A8B7NEI8_HYAAZ|nr:carbohydrate sulfotransferase 8 [Hyalella azteca]XP_047740129.1 carbohydrate sulfotransferase 8 [Hyalella azteca]
MGAAKFTCFFLAVLSLPLLLQMYQVKRMILTQPHTSIKQGGFETRSLNAAARMKNLSVSIMTSKGIVGDQKTREAVKGQPSPKLPLYLDDEPKTGDNIGREALYAERRARLERVCHEHRNQTSFGGVAAAPRAQLRWLNREQLVVCFSAKVGTTSWCHYLLKHAFPNASYFNTSNAQLHLIALRQLVSQPQRLDILQQLGSYTKVVNVRHPFARLVSAYRDKIEPCSTDPKCYANRKRPPLPTMLDFKDFVQFLIDKIKVPVVADRSSFNSYDVHWRPYFLNCGVCDLSYKYIIKMETWNEDLRYLLPKFNIAAGDDVHGNALNSTNASYRYFKTLPRPLILQLYEIYKIDFEMFDYSLDEYLQ